MPTWFRFYAEALNDPKVQTLDAETFRHWVNLLCIQCRDGRLPVTSQETSFALRIDDNACRTLLERLANATLLDRVNGGVNGFHYEIHGWDKRQYKSDTSAERMKRHRARHRDVTVTPPEADTDTDTERKKESSVPPVQVAETVDHTAGVPDDELSSEDLFWRIATEAAKDKKFSKSQAGKLCNLLGGDFDRGVQILRSSAGAKVPAAYLAKVIKGVEADTMAPSRPLGEAGEPDFVTRYRIGGYTVEKLPAGRWRLAGREFNAAGEMLDG